MVRRESRWAIVLAMGLAACGEDADSGQQPNTISGTGGSSANGGSGASAGGASAGGASTKSGSPGTSCQNDADCTGGTCLAPLFAGKDRYCATPCQTNSDCGAFAAGSYSIDVPTTVTPQGGAPEATIWKASTLERGVLCTAKGAKSGAASYCQFVCPDFSAVVLDSTGNVVDCPCLPGYRISADKTHCEVNPSIQCTIFSLGTDAQRQTLKDQYGIESSSPKCTACNSDFALTDSINCHTNRLTCVISGNGLEGGCEEVMTSKEFNDCIKNSIYQSCDCECPEASACSEDGSNCACCTCTGVSTPPPKPTCTGESTGSGGTSGSGGSGGTPGGGGSAGAQGNGGSAGAQGNGGSAGAQGNGGSAGAQGNGAQGNGAGG